MKRIRFPQLFAPGTLRLVGPHHKRRARLAALCLPLLVSSSNTRAASTQLWIGPGSTPPAGGYYSMAEYGPEYAVSTIQAILDPSGSGQSTNIMATAVQDLYFRFEGSSSTSIKLTYSLRAEASQSWSLVRSIAAIKVFEFLPGYGNTREMWSDSINFELFSPPPSSASKEKLDQVIYLHNWNTAKDLHISLQAFTSGYLDRRNYRGADMLFSATAYADPEVSTSGAIVTQYDRITEVHREEDAWLIPEPSTSILLVLGVAGLGTTALARRRA